MPGRRFRGFYGPFTCHHVFYQVYKIVIPGHWCSGVSCLMLIRGNLYDFFTLEVREVDGFSSRRFIRLGLSVDRDLFNFLRTL